MDGKPLHLLTFQNNRFLRMFVNDVAHGCSPKDLVKRLRVVEYNT